jgi:RNA polymerase sigma factor (TIGR02999 family)
MSSLQETTSLLRNVRDGDAVAADQLLPLVYRELRAMAGAAFRGQPADHTLQPTALVHEVFLKIVDQTGVDWRDRAHFFAVAATAMRQILVDHARAAGAAKRGGNRQRVSLSRAQAADNGDAMDVLALHEVLDELARLDPRQARVVELRFFTGLSVSEAAEVLGVSKRTVDLDWQMARAWLSQALSESDRFS